MLTRVGQAVIFLPELVCPALTATITAGKKIAIKSCSQESSRTNTLLKINLWPFHFFAVRESVTKLLTGVNMLLVLRWLI